MKNNVDEKISAQVAVKPDAAGSTYEIADAFARAGFTTGNVVASNFSITASSDRFDAFFGTDAVQAARSHRSDTLAVPSGAMPDSLRNKVEAVVFTNIDFGPGKSY